MGLAMGLWVVLMRGTIAISQEVSPNYRNYETVGLRLSSIRFPTEIETTVGKAFETFGNCIARRASAIGQDGFPPRG